MRLRGEPPVELLTASVARRRRCLSPAFVFAARAAQTYVEVVVVAPPRAYLGQPRPVRPGLPAQRALDRRIDKDSRHGGLAGDGLEQTAVLRQPGRGIDIVAVCSHDVGRRHLVALGGAEPP